MADQTDGQQQDQQGQGGGNATVSRDEFEALKAEREALLQKRDELLNEVKGVKRRFDGIDPDEVKSLRQKLAEYETQHKADKAGITSEQLEKIRGEVRQSYEQEYAPVKTQLEELMRENRALKLDNVVKAEMARAGVVSDRIDDLYRLAAHEFDLTDDGKPMLKDRAGVEISAFIGQELLKKYPEWFSGTGSSGGGASRSSGGAVRGARVVTADDNDAFISNLEGIAKGTVSVRS